MSLTYSSCESIGSYKKQKRRAAYSALLLALVFVGVASLLLLLWKLSVSLQKDPMIQPVPLVQERIQSEEPPTIQRIQPKPATPPAAAAPPIVMSMAPSVVTVPQIQVMPNQLALGPSVGKGLMGIGQGNGGFGGGRGDGGSNPFGDESGAPGLLKGQLYDLKRDQEGNPTRYRAEEANTFVEPVVDVLSLLRRGRNVEESSDLFVVGEDRFMNTLAVPVQNADNGPSAFEAEGELEPTGWMIHYGGTIESPRSGKFRFVGMGDDLLTVQVNGKMRLNASWPDIANKIDDRWRSSGPTNHPSPQDPPLVYGDWINAREGEEMSVEILFGERPGGMVGCILLVEWQEEEYRKGENQRPILPPFTLLPLTSEELERLENFRNFELELENVPLFGSF